MRLHLIRHGQTPSNLLRALDTSVPGPGLTPTGEEQAAALALSLADEPIEAVWASSMLRTQRTARPLATARGLDVVVRDGLREVTAGDLEMRTDDAAAEQYLTTLFAWADGDLGRQMPGGEDGYRTLGRFDAVVQEILGASVDVAAAVSHGAMIRLWCAARADNVTTSFASDHALANTGVVTLDSVATGDATGWTVTRWEAVTVPSALADESPGGEPLDEV